MVWYMYMVGYMYGMIGYMFDMVGYMYGMVYVWYGMVQSTLVITATFVFQISAVIPTLPI